MFETEVYFVHCRCRIYTIVSIFPLLQSTSQATEDVDGSIHSHPKLVDNTLRVLQTSPAGSTTPSKMSADIYNPNTDSYSVTEHVSREEDFQDPLITSETVVGEDGVARTITKKTVTKTVTTHTTRKIEGYDTESLPRNHDGRIDGSYHSDVSSSLGRNRVTRESPHDETARLLKQPSTSSSNSDLHGGSQEGPVGYTRPYQNNYEQPEVRRLTPEKFQPEEYGLEDDRRSEYDDDNDGYGLEPIANQRDYNGRAHQYEMDSSGSSTPRHNRYDDPVEEIMQNDAPVAAPRSAQKQMGRAPLAEMEAGSQASIDRLGRKHDWRTPELQEVIKMLSYPMEVVQQNAAAYLQHLCFNDNNVKANVRRLGGIPPLIRLLDHSNPKVQLRACGALRNLSYGPKNNDNKLAIKSFEGVPALVKVVKESRDPEVKEQATGTLWNLSAHKELKGQILELAMEPLSSLVIIPYSGYQEQQRSKPKKVDLPDILTNSLGVLRNLSSQDSPEYRSRLRDCDDLVDALVYFLRMNVEKEEVENKATENCVSILRNLTYQLYTEAPGADQYKIDTENKPPQQNETTCFGKKKSKAEEGETVDQIPPADVNAHGHELLWQPDVVGLYLSLLSSCARFPETLEAAAGAIQNLAHGDWQWALYARAVVRKEKGLPVLVDRLRTDNDRVIRAVAIALTNLSQDYKNKDLIGKYAMKDLAYKLPGGSDSHVVLSDLTYIAILNTIRVVVEKRAANARYLREAGGIERITTINNSRDSKYHTRVVKAAGQVLQALWAIKELHSMYKKDGWNKSHFQPTVTAATLPRKQKAMNNRPYEDAQESVSFAQQSKAAEAHEMNKSNRDDGEYAAKSHTDSWV